MEASSPCFTETQAFRQPWLWALLWALLIGWGVWATIQLGLGMPVGTRPMPSWALLLTGLLPIGLVFHFWRMRLYTRVEPDGLAIRFTPFHDWRHFAWEEIEQMQIRVYAPIGEFGGWGLRSNASGRAWTVAGDLGLEITLQSGERWLIGTQAPQALKEGILACAPEALWLP